MDSVKVIQLELLEDFIRVCDELHLPYTAMGGTLLGAVRHHGYVPWDDDIDVAMPRDSYEAFMAQAQAHLQKHHFLQTFETDPEYRLSYAKLRHDQTTFIENASRHMNIHHGIYIDIFPLDGYPPTRLTQAWYRLKLAVINCRILAEFNAGRTPKATLVMAFARLCIPSWRYAIRRKEKLLKSYPYRSSKQVGIFCDLWCNTRTVGREILGHYTHLSFERLSIAVPQNYDAYLKIMFGDYWQLPPEEKRQPHHTCTVIDPQRSYLDYRNTKQ